MKDKNTEYRSQEKGDRRQESGKRIKDKVGIQNTGDRSQKTESVTSYE